MESTTRAGNASLEAFQELEKDVLELADTLNIVIRSMEELSAGGSKILAVMNE